MKQVSPHGASPIDKFEWRGGQGPDPWEFVVVIAIFFSLFALFRGCMKSAHAAECKPRLIAFIEKCDVTGCRVQMPDGTFGMGKFPLEFAKVSEVCQ